MKKTAHPPSSDFENDGSDRIMSRPLPHFELSGENFSVYCAKKCFYLRFLNILVAETANHLTFYSYGDYLCVTQKGFVLCGRKKL